MKKDIDIYIYTYTEDVLFVFVFYMINKGEYIYRIHKLHICIYNYIEIGKFMYLCEHII